MNTHQCKRCCEVKPWSAYTLRRGRPHTYCKLCRRVLVNAKRGEYRLKKPAYYADSAEGRRYRRFQALLNAVPAYTRGNLAAVLA